MSQQTLNAPPINSPFTTGDSSEKGDTPNRLVTKLTANFNELYGRSIQIPSRLRTLAAIAQPPQAMASPPIFTLSAANAVATTNGNYNCRYDNADLTVFTYAGGVPLAVVTAGQFSNISMSGGASFYGTGNGSHGTLDIYWGSDAPILDLAFKLQNNFDITYRLWVDELDG